MIISLTRELARKLFFLFLSIGLFNAPCLLLASNDAPRLLLALDGQSLQLISLTSVGFESPIIEYQQDGDARVNTCPMGTSSVEVLPYVANRDWPLYACQTNESPYQVRTAEGLRYIFSAGIFGNYVDHDRGVVEQYNNPYTGEAACPTGPGYKNGKVYGEFSNSYGIRMCWYETTDPTDNPFPNHQFRGFSTTGSCLSGGTPHQIHGHKVG